MKKQIIAGVAGSMLIAGSAMAEVPAAVTTAITGAGTDAVTVATACFVAIIGLLAFGYMRKAAK